LDGLPPQIQLWCRNPARIVEPMQSHGEIHHTTRRDAIYGVDSDPEARASGRVPDLKGVTSHALYLSDPLTVAAVDTLFWPKSWLVSCRWRIHRLLPHFRCDSCSFTSAR